MANHHSSHLSHINPSYKAVGSCDTEEEVEFDFWAASRTQNYNSCSDRRRSCETQLIPRFAEYFDDNSTLVWKISTPTDLKHEYSPLLPSKHHHYSEVATKPSSQVIAEGRRELMEMISNLPESSVELSLKDIVDEKNVSLGGQEDVAIHETSFDFNTEDQLQKHNIRKTKNISKSSSQVSRTGSMMKKETFLIKMFIPKALSWQRKVEAKHGLKASENHEHKRWWIQGFFAIGGHQTGGISSSSRRSSCINSYSSASRHRESYQGCWPRFGGKTSKSGRLGRCIPSRA